MDIVPQREMFEFEVVSIRALQSGALWTSPPPLCCFLRFDRTRRALTGTCGVSLRRW